MGQNLATASPANEVEDTSNGAPAVRTLNVPFLLPNGVSFRPEMFHYVALFQQLQITQPKFEKLISYFRMYTDKALWEINIMKRAEFERFISIHALPHQKRIFGRNSMFKLLVGDSQDYLHFAQWLMIVLLLDIHVPHDLRRPSGQLRLSLIFRLYDKGGKGYLDYPDIQKLLLDLQSVAHPEDKNPAPDAATFLKLANDTPALSILEFMHYAGDQRICGTSQILRFFCSFTRINRSQSKEFKSPTHPPGNPVPFETTDVFADTSQSFGVIEADTVHLEPPRVEANVGHKVSGHSNDSRPSQYERLINPAEVPVLARFLGPLREEQVKYLPNPSVFGYHVDEPPAPTKPVKPPTESSTTTVAKAIGTFTSAFSKPAQTVPTKPPPTHIDKENQLKQKAQSVDTESYVFGMKPGTKLFMPDRDRQLVEVKMGPMRIPTRQKPNNHLGMCPPIAEGKEFHRSNSGANTGTNMRSNKAPPAPQRKVGRVPTGAQNVLMKPMQNGKIQPFMKAPQGVKLGAVPGIKEELEDFVLEVNVCVTTEHIPEDSLPQLTNGEQKSRMCMQTADESVLLKPEGIGAPDDIGVVVTEDTDVKVSKQLKETSKSKENIPKKEKIKKTQAEKAAAKAEEKAKKKMEKAASKEAKKQTKIKK
eukprot:Platyproteum_vivax@DN4491_c0_g1_i1.p1